jgi:hypothetical protein
MSQVIAIAELKEQPATRSGIVEVTAAREVRLLRMLVSTAPVDEG